MVLRLERQYKTYATKLRSTAVEGEIRGTISGLSVSYPVGSAPPTGPV